MTISLPDLLPLLILLTHPLLVQAAIEPINQESNYVFPTSIKNRRVGAIIGTNVRHLTVHGRLLVMT